MSLTKTKLIRMISLKYLLALILTINTLNAYSSDLFVGYGDSIDSDQDGESFYSISVREGDWEFSLAHWEEYNRTSWWEDHPEWHHATWAIETVSSHNMFGVTYELYEYEFTDNFKFFFDFGFTYTDVVSHVNSSHLLFKEHVGLEWGDVRLSWTHSSNAGLEGDNAGEDGLHLQFKLWEW